MVEIKTFRIKAEYWRQKKRYVFSKEIRDLTLDRAIEKFYSYIGAQGVKRNEVKIVEIKEITPEEIKNKKLQKLVMSETPALYVE